MRTTPLLALAACLTLAAPAQAKTSWTVCHYDVEAVRIERGAALTVRLLRARAPLAADCPAAQGEMTFRPESADYQSELPTRQWPRPGQRSVLVYRHLDGICKESGPCRIKHHSLLPVPAASTPRTSATMPTTTLLTKDTLDTLKRRILESGKTCLYSNMFNNTPCLQVGAFHLFLNPDPGPDGHPQWNINCDPAKGDFNTLVVRDDVGRRGYASVEFMDAHRVVVKDHHGSDEAALRALLEEAVGAAMQTP